MSFSASGQYVMKLLEGPLNGLELPLGCGEYFFCIGPDQFLEDPASQTLKRAANAIFLPASSDAVNFTLHVAEEHRDGVDAALLRAVVHYPAGSESLDLPCNELIRIGATCFAVFPAGDIWSDTLGQRATTAAFLPATAAPLVAAAAAPGAPRQPRRFKFALATCAAFFLVGVLSFAGWRWLVHKDGQPSALSEVFDVAPFSYQFAVGADGLTYVLASGEADAEWARQALSKKNERDRPVILTRAAEVERMAALLKQSNIASFTVRLDKMDRPEILVSADRNSTDTAFVARTQKLAKAAMPYAGSVSVTLLKDEDLIARATAGLERLGVPYRAEYGPAGVLLRSTGPVNDVQLAQLNDFRRGFYKAWGDQFVNIQIQLGDAPYKDRSFKFGGDAYVMLSRNHWNFIQPLTTKE